ncbi:MAG: HPP family protein [Hapalosiphonaceae cyanobacterium JJU2]|nr:MAG: HPP family protein [Hapalosiphonaceae cyanobacterium JJU2]
MRHTSTELESIKPGNSSKRRRLTLKGEFVLALMPTLIILTVLALVEVLSRQRLLFASLASSAFLIYLDPQHGTNTVRTLITSQMLAATIGLLTYLALGPGYLSGGSAMVLTIVLMILLDAVHPPAVSTSLSFALRAGHEKNLVLFSMAVGITAILVLLERCALWLLTYHSRHRRG